ncbi:TrkH family potassium uptake protein [Clostridium sp. D2Q-11]|uniref:TrkH family potassium uptake protein n=1 Tax=Anaeromonas frigoriresistens TaxID=2683708 RepID=A0A942UX51_9FIRM|nr:TrkH family potassium uptake protein [Anaeromonas frigoriresistens]MBS4537991.1 TrkH family potassium uptake protein [Anaeromonas frigoriresistens]
MIKIELKNRMNELKSNPAQVLVLGFAALIFIGATLLNLPMASASGRSIGFIDALFTSASAVCVTGLVVVNTAAHWTIFGKIVILVLIQIGGLGFMTMATLVSLLIGKKITLKDRLIMQEELNQFTLSGLVKLTRYIIISTFVIEAIGAVFLAFKFIPEYGTLQGIWYSIFHAISAYCNAGFDIIGNSMESFVTSPIVNFTISILVILGGLGYSVYIDMTENRKFKKFLLHTKVVLVMSIGLLVLGFLVFLIVEYNNPQTIGNLSFGSKLIASFFQSVVPRTAGFNSVSMAGTTNATAFLIIILMFIGGSPGSTAGGIKTTTMGVILLAVVAVVRGETDVEIFGRRIPNEIIFRALAVLGIGLLIVIIVTMTLSLTENNLEDYSFLDITFETVSAFGTVGLSRGLTPYLSDIGRIIITITMFIGRLGPLTMAFAFAKKRREKKGLYRYPEERITVG